MRFGEQQRFEAKVLVDDKDVREYVDADDNTWVETTFTAQSTFREDVVETDPFGETYAQSCPFTPFKVFVSVLHDEPGACYWAQVFVDGKIAQRLMLKGPHCGKTFVGFAQRMGHTGGEKSFCFSMPRPVFEVAGRSNIEPEQDAEKLKEIGSVRIDLHKTLLIKTEVRTVSSGFGGRHQGGGVDFEPTDKKTAKSLGSTAAVRAGPALPGGREQTAGWGACSNDGWGGLVKGELSKTETVVYYESPTESNKVASGRIRYCTREKLDDLGLLDLDSMGLLDSSAAGLGSLAAAPPLPAASDKYSAAHMEACLKHQFGAEFKVTPDVRNALRECEGTYMPVQPSIKAPKVKLPSTFCEWSVGQALLDNQQLSAAAIGGAGELKRKTALVARQIHGDQETSLSRAMAHQIFGSEQLYRVVEKFLAQAPASGDSCDSSDLSRLAQVLSANILVWPASDSNEPILVKPRVSKFETQCYCLGLSVGGAFTPSRGRYWSMMTEEDERKEEETKAANKAKRRKGGA